MIALDGGNYNGLIALFALVMLGPPLLLTIIGFAIKKNNPKAAKVCFILGAVYVLIGLGICGGFISV